MTLAEGQNGVQNTAPAVDTRAERPAGERGGRRGRGERGEGGGRRERGERPTDAAALPADSGTAETRDPAAAPTDSASEAPRERRSRDRYGRERRDRTDRELPRADGASPAAADASTAPVAEWVSTEPANLAAVILGAEAVMGGGALTANAAAAAPVADAPVAEPAPAPVVAPEAAQETTLATAPVAAVVASAAPATPALPAYTLPVDALHQIAQGSGLEWVNSDAAKVAEVQASIAAQPSPVHVPRERPPVVVADDGPLVLVETKRDLRQVAMPFDTPGA